MIPKILIVGAGPVGLTVALELKKYGIPFEIVDKRTEKASQSKALSVSAASLKVFHGLGLWSKFANKGQRVKDVYIYLNGRRCAHINKRYLGPPFDFYLSLAQPETERVLEDHLESQGARVLYGHEFCNLVQVEEGVDVIVRDISTGRIVTKQYAAVVGCDGAHSVVAKSLKIESFEHDYGHHFVMGDVRLSNSPKDDTTCYYVLDDGFMIYLPMAAGLARVVVSRPGPLPVGAPPPSQFELQAALDKFLLEKTLISEVLWASSSRFLAKVARQSAVGRVYLAGDALHLFSPIGGQGMNTGLQDAVNLGWKLAFTHRGLAKAPLLTSYSEERLPAVQRTFERIHRNTLQILRVRQLPKATNPYVPSIRLRKLYRHHLPYEFAGFLADYSEDGESMVGKHVPYCESRRSDVLVSNTYDVPQCARNVVFSRKVNILALDSSLTRYHHVAVQAYLDESEEGWLKALSLFEYDVCLVRPDGYIGYIGDLSGLENYLDTYYHANGRQPTSE